jgi:hypothetical protein
MGSEALTRPLGHAQPAPSRLSCPFPQPHGGDRCKSKDKGINRPVCPHERDNDEVASYLQRRVMSCELSQLIQLLSSLVPREHL